MKRACFPTPGNTLTCLCSKPSIFTAPGPYGDQDSKTAGQGCTSHFSQQKHAALRNSWFVSTCTAWKAQEATSPRQGRQQPLRLTQRETPSSHVAPWSSESRHLLPPPHPHPKPLALNERPVCRGLLMWSLWNTFCHLLQSNSFPPLFSGM